MRVIYIYIFFIFNNKNIYIYISDTNNWSKETAGLSHSLTLTDIGYKGWSGGIDPGTFITWRKSHFTIVLSNFKQISIL